MITALLLSLAVAGSDPKTDRQPPTDCVLAETFKNDLRSGGFFISSGDRDVAIRYAAALVLIGYPKPPVDMGAIAEILFVTNPKSPDKVLIALVDTTGAICAAAVIPASLHDSILRGV